MQEKRVLYPLKNYKYGYNGLIMYPDGKARIINYRGYNYMEWVNNGNNVIPYISAFNQEE